MRPPRLTLDVRGMMGITELFRVSGGVRHDPAIDAWLADEPIALRSIAQQWFLRIRRCGDDVRELIHDGCPVACVEDAPFACVNTFTQHVNVGFHRGAHLADPARLLEGDGKHMRHVKVRPGKALDATALADLIEAAYADMKKVLRSG